MAGPTMSRRTFLAGSAAGAAALTVAGPTLWAPPARAEVPLDGLHLAFGADARERLVVSWSTPQSVRNPRLEVGVDDRFGQPVAVESRSAPGVATVYHHARVEGLQAGRSYRFRASHDGGTTVVGLARTAPTNAQRFRFATFGDMGVSGDAGANVATLVHEQPAFCFVVGDLCYADKSGGVAELAAMANDPTVWDAWLRQIAPSAGQVPWMATVGNHEMERGAGELGYDGYLARFSPPTNGPSPVTYCFRYANVAFLALDGNDASYEISRNRDHLGGRQEEWLRDSLRALRADPAVDFVVAGFHNCMFCTNVVHGSDGGNRERWQPIFDEFAVDLVVNGHNHCYERTHPIRRGEPVLEADRYDASVGTTYLTVGGAGQAAYPTSAHPASYVSMEGPGYGGTRVPEAAPWSAVRHLDHSIALVDVAPRAAGGPATMTVRVLDKGRREIDRVTLERR